MSRHHDELYIRHMRQATQKIITRLQGVTRELFDRDEEKQDGIIRG